MNIVPRDRIRPFLIAATLCLVGAALAYANPNPPLSEQPVHGGDITGALTSCGSPASGVTVYIPGRSFLAITDQAGGFKLNYVPPGTYPLVVRNRDNQDIATIPGVVVIKNRLTALGDVAIACEDGDGDGFAPPADCDDANPAVNPGAAEVCQDGIDNDCDAQIDESCPECQIDQDCETSFFCNASNACEAKRENGEACTENAQCLSRSCVLDVCTAAPS